MYGPVLIRDSMATTGLDDILPSKVKGPGVNRALVARFTTKGVVDPADVWARTSVGHLACKVVTHNGTSRQDVFLPRRQVALMTAFLTGPTT